MLKLSIEFIWLLAIQRAEHCDTVAKRKCTILLYVLEENELIEWFSDAKCIESVQAGILLRGYPIRKNIMPTYD